MPTPLRSDVARSPFEEWDSGFAGGGASTGPDDQGGGRGKPSGHDVSWGRCEGFRDPALSENPGKRYRLTSEAEWGITSARAGTNTSSGGGAPPPKGFANCEDAALPLPTGAPTGFISVRI